MTDGAGQENGRHGESQRKISTFVFLDFEATSLTRPRITELCLLAVNRVDLCSNRFPRVSNKLVLCVDPQKPIDHGASSITGLYNDGLEPQKPWSADTVSLINCFLSHLAAPVCLVAHNGNGFDFPLLVSELRRVNKSLDKSLYCADSLEGFRELDGLPRKYVRQSNGTPNHNVAGKASPANVNTPPSKLAERSAPPPLKRKSADNIAVCNAKIVKPSASKLDVSFGTENVKKRLTFGEADVADVHNGEKADCSQKSECLFSESLEDCDYLLALDMAEKELDASRSGDADSDVDMEASTVEDSSAVAESVAETVNADDSTEQTEVDSDAETQPCTNGSVVLTDPLKPPTTTVPDAVAAGSGYMVRGKERIQETVDLPAVTDNSTPKIQDAIVVDKETPNDFKRDTSAFNLPAATDISTRKCPDNITASSDTDKHVCAPSVTPNAKQNIAAAVSSINSPVSTQWKSYKLEEIYFRTFGTRPEITHSAEADCVMLMKISTRVPSFLEWIDQNAVLLSSLQVL